MTCQWHVRAATRPAPQVPSPPLKTGLLLLVESALYEYNEKETVRKTGNCEEKR